MYGFIYVCEGFKRMQNKFSRPLEARIYVLVNAEYATVCTKA